MSAIPVYEVEFIPLERRLNDRRVASGVNALPPGVTTDRRKANSRRTEDPQPATRNIN